MCNLHLLIKMKSREIKIKDDTSNYIIYWPIPCNILPPIGQDIPVEGCQCVSIDPAIKNFAIRIEKRYKTGYIETLYMNRIDFSQYDNSSETNGTTGINPQILYTASSILMELLPIFQESRIIAIERQLAINYKSTRIFQHILTFFLMVINTFKNYCIIMDINPKLKGKMLGAPKGLNHYSLKMWSIDKAIELLTWRNDQLALQIINHHRKNKNKQIGKTKADDLADTVNQIEAWFMLNGGISTSPTLFI